MFPILQVGPAALPIPGLVLLAGIWIGISLAEKYAEIHQSKSSDIYNIIFISLIAGILGGRLGYVILNWGSFLSDLPSIFSRNLELFDPTIGLICAVLAFFIYISRKNINIWITLDALTPFFAILNLSIAISHLASGNAFGSPTTLPWGIKLWGEYRHPTQVYEIILSVIILVLIWPRKGIAWYPQPGVTFLRFIAFTATGLLIVEGFRGDSILLSSGIRSLQVYYWLILAASLLGLRKLQIRNTKSIDGEK